MALSLTWSCVRAQEPSNGPPPPDAAGTAASAPYQLEIRAPDPLGELLTKYLDISRFRTDPALADITAGEIARLVAATPAQARGLLETEGYFNAEVKVTREETVPPTLHVEVDPGPRARISRSTLEVQGEIQENAERGFAADIDLLAQIQRGWRLREDRSFRQSSWNSEKNEVLARLRADGYPGASWSGTAAEVDAPNNAVRLFAVADSGPLYRFGSLRVEGLQHHDAEAVTNLATFREGDRYTEKQLFDFQERLQKLNLFESISVVADTDPEKADAAPVAVNVRELPLQELTLGVGYSDASGVRGTFEHLHRRVFGLSWRAKTKLQLGSDQSTFSSEWTSQPHQDLYRNMVAFKAERLDKAGTAPTDSESLRIGRTQDTERIDRTYYLEYVSARVTTDLGKTDSRALWGNYEWVWRNVDNILLPTRGITLSAQAGAGQARSSDGNGPFGRLYGRATWYQPLGGMWYASARGEAGEVFTQGTVGVPDTLLFRTGGDESVRGYDYNTIGVDEGGTIVGGKVLGTASFEIAHPISRRLRQWWWAVFVDAGDATNTWTNFDPKLGYGTGIRWRSPVGVLRADVAYGQETENFRLHVGVGIAF